MFSSLPENSDAFMDWNWAQIAPYYADLANRTLTAANAAEWLKDWTRLGELISERQSLLAIATSLNTADKDAKAKYFDYLDNISPYVQAEEQKLKQKLIDSTMDPDGFDIPLKNMRAEAELFREANIPLFTEESKLGTQYDEIIGAQTVKWDGEEVTLTQLRARSESPDRAIREKAWRIGIERRLADREAINKLWGQFLALRKQIAANAGYSNYRDFRWRQMLRFDYTPDDCRSFQRAIEEVVVPAATRVYERKRKQLGVDTLRPWDLGRDYIYPVSRPSLHPFQEIAELEDKTAAIFQRVDPQLAGYYETMRREKLLDLDNRKNKAPGAYCAPLAARRLPYVFENAVGMHEDVETLLHECGHAFHVFESRDLPYLQQQQIGMEFAEVASMTMELFGLPYLPAAEGGFYSEPEAARARVEHLEKILIFWPYMAVIDAFQHWVYENPTAAADPANCDATWADMWTRYIPGIDWSGLEQEMMTGWHRKLHIHQAPFYYVEYGLAQLGAVQVWRNALTNQAGAVAAYRRALALGGTVPLPQLFATAGARFAFDAPTLRSAVDLIEQKIGEWHAA